MALDQVKIDTLEDTAYIGATERYFVRVGAEHEHPWVREYYKDIKREGTRRASPKVAKDSLRSHGGDGIRQIQDQTTSECFEAREACATILRDIATEMAISYFRQLKVYLEARETGVEAIDEIIEEVALFSALLLRQIEGALSSIFKNPRDLDKVTASAINDLKKLIDFDRVVQSTGFTNLFKNPRVNHYSGFRNDGCFFAARHDQYDGLRPEDILLFLNSTDPVTLYFGEHDSDDSNRLGVINPNGTIDLERESP